jgi:hypothetical protein
MTQILRKRLGCSIAVWGALFASTANAQMPTDRPFSMRGVELGITIDEFREVAIPNDDNRYENMQSACSNGTHKLSSRIHPSSEDGKAGVVECKWFSSLASLLSKSLWEHWVNIGNGKGIPTFRFIENEGELRLFQISFYANNQYHADILDALTRGYGEAKEVSTPFKTKAGGQFSSLKSTWKNGLSSITLVERCAHLERYCLTYEHNILDSIYHERKEVIASEAASRI